jgi:hypothetical protein
MIVHEIKENLVLSILKFQSKFPSGETEISHQDLSKVRYMLVGWFPMAAFGII